MIFSPVAVVILSGIIQGDVLQLLNGNCFFRTQNMKETDEPILRIGKWDMIIAFPPCTYLSNAGACRLYPKKGQFNIERYKKGLEARAFFMKFYTANCDKIAIENPVSSHIFNMPKHTQEIQPYQFGHPVTKKTRLWLKNLPSLQPTNIVEPEAPYIPAGTSRKDPTKYGQAIRKGKDAVQRSKTFPGIAKTMAEQWAGANTSAAYDEKVM